MSNLKVYKSLMNKFVFGLIQLIVLKDL